MVLREFSAIFLLILTSFLASGANPSKSELESIYDKAFSAFDEKRYDDALEALDAIDARQPDLAESLNLRGVVYMRQGKYDKAEATFRKALSIDPRFWNASFNLAEIPFLQKNWVEARNRFTGLMAGESSGMQPETSHLIQYKILLTFVLQGKGNTVDWILNKFEAAKGSPALYYSNAAIAFAKNDPKEANEWIEAAKKQFPEPLNKLYAESLHEVGWTKKPPGEARVSLEIASAAERAARLKADARANFEKAERAFEQRDFKGALQLLDLTDEGLPNDPAALNLRGEILMKEGKLDEGEVAFRKALASNPKFSQAKYNLAQVPFQKGEYAKSRNRFEELYAETPGGEKNQAAQLIKYQIFMTLLLEEKESEAQQLMDQFKFTGDTPALYYAQAAWEFKHGRNTEANDWLASARKIYSPALNLIFADTFYDLGWLHSASSEQPPSPTSAFARANASPASSEPTPAMTFGQAESLPEPLAEETASPSPATEESSPVAVADTSATPIAAPVATPEQGVQPIGTEARGAVSAASSPPGTTPQAGTVGRAVEPASAETVDRLFNPRSLFLLALLLAGISLVVWLVVRNFRRKLPNAASENPSEVEAESPATGDDSFADEEHKVSRHLISSAPPKVSAVLLASEPSAWTGNKPSQAVTARGALPGVDEPFPAPSEHSSESGSKTFPQPAASVTPPSVPRNGTVPPAAPEGGAEKKSPELPRDQEEISSPPKLAAAETETQAEDAAVESNEPIELADGPVGQGQPIPHLTTALSPEPAIPEMTQPEPESELVLIGPDETFAAPIAGRETEQSAIETPSFASKIITTPPIPPQPNTSRAMHQTTTMPAPASPATTSTMSVQQPVRVTFSLEIAAMQLTPAFKMDRLQLKPTSKVVSMRLASAQDPQSSQNLQISFEVVRVEPSNGALGTVRLAPSAQQQPAVLGSPSFAVSSLELVQGQGAAPVQLVPSHQEQASVQLTAEFQIAAIEFTPLFEIATIVLNSTSKKVSMQLPGSGPSSIESAPVFEIENVQPGSGNDLGLIQVTPDRS